MNVREHCYHPHDFWRKAVSPLAGMPESVIPRGFNGEFMIDYQALNLLQPESEADTFTEERYRQFCAHLPKRARTVLDIGCNTGRGGAAMKAMRPSLDLSGLDAVEQRVRRLPRGVYTRGVHGYSTNIPLGDESVDAVVAGEFIEHIVAADVAPTLNQIFRVLKMRGRILLTTPNPSDIKRRMRGDSILGGSHVSQHNARVLKLQLLMAGYSNVRVFGSGKVTRYVGQYMPLMMYGSYLIMGDKF